MNEIEIGKFAIESLTTGMYEQSLIVFREYIQNAADALEEAVRNNVIQPRDMSVNIRVNTELREIEIQDVGMGISSDRAASVLMSIGQSSKDHTQSRGFRGIGRLGGISYCECLQFETTAYGDDKLVRVSFDCSTLKKKLIPGQTSTESAVDVIRAVCSIETEEIDPSEHFFVVRMIGVDDRTDLLNEEMVRSYLSQTSPIPYSPNFKMLSDHIYRDLKKYDVELTEFPVYITFDNGRTQRLYKPFSRRYVAGRGKDTDSETIYDIEFFDVYNPEGKLLAVGWYGQGAWTGTLKDPAIRGLRLRKGNIQIGDENTLDSIFKQTRFNGWCQGEVFVLSDELIPNARRDNFEKNDAFFELLAALKPVGEKISNALTEASRLRNDPVQKLNVSATEIVRNIEEKLASGFNSMEEAVKAKQDIVQTQTALERAKSSKAEVVQRKQEILDQLKETFDKLDDGTPFKGDRLKGVLNKKEKSVFNKVTDILTKYLDDPLLTVIIDEIVDELLK